ncbi:MAG TPA: alpha/beta fold hydrolase [Pseudolabrys sp.]|nr:alpha/beta fold hydrolase [Pseudolabrys sp.]
MTETTPVTYDLDHEVIGDGPTIVFLHPIAMRGAFWRPVATLLKDRFRAVLVDLRGHGTNPRPQEPFSLDDLAADVIRLVRAKGWNPAAFVGCSLGGMVAQGVAVHAPELVSGLVIANSTHRMTPQGVEVMSNRAQQALNNFASAVESDLLRWFSPDFSKAHPETVDQARQWALANAPRVVANGWRAIAGLNYESRLANVRQPVLAMTGSLDPASPPAQTQAIAQAFPNGRFLELTGAGHFAPLEQPEAFANAVRSLAEKR